MKIVDEKLVLAQELSVKKDVLSVCFDQDGNLWISYGLVSFQELNNLVDVSRFDESTSSYLPFNHDDELTMHVNQVANISIPVLPEYYEIGMHSKAAIQKKISEKPRGKKVVEEESEEENHEAKKQKH